MKLEGRPSGRPSFFVPTYLEDMKTNAPSLGFILALLFTTVLVTNGVAQSDGGDRCFDCRGDDAFLRAALWPSRRPG